MKRTLHVLLISFVIGMTVLSGVGSHAVDGQPADATTDKAQAQETFDIAGIIRASNGKPLENADVRLYESYTGSEQLHAQAQTDAEGKFTFSDIPREKRGLWRYTLTASAPTFASRVVFVPHAPVHFELALPEPASLRGRVVNADDHPVEGASVWTPPLKEPIPGVHTATTDVNGYFQIDDLAPWNSAQKGFAQSIAGHDGWSNVRYYLRIHHPDFGTKLAKYAQVPTSVFVKFGKPMLLTGRVSYSDTKEPAADVLVKVGGISSRTNEQGRYRLAVQPREQLKVVAEDGEGKSQTIVLQGTPAATVELADLLLNRTKASGESHSGESSEDSVAELRQQYQNLAAGAARLAAELRAAEPSRAADLEDQIRGHVEAAFHARQRLQAAELAAQREQLERIDYSIQQHEQAKDEIVEDRVNELLNPELQRQRDEVVSGSADGSAASLPAASIPGAVVDIPGRMAPSDAPPSVEGIVTDLDKEAGDELVEISIGARDGLRIGQTFVVFRDRAFLGQITLQHVGARTSVGRIEQRREEIRPGDRVTPTGVPGSSSSASTRPDGGLRWLLTAYEQADLEAQRLAETLHTGERAESGDPSDVPRATEGDLRNKVAEAFEARQTLLRGELSGLRQRLEAIEHLVETRERRKDEIIDQRVKELLDPALRWEPMSRTGRAMPSLSRTAGVPSSDLDRLLEIERQQWQFAIEQFRAGTRSIDDVIRAAKELFQVERATSSTTEQAALSKHVGRLQDLMGLVEARVAVGRATRTELQSVEAELLKARLGFTADEPAAVPRPPMDLPPDSHESTWNLLGAKLDLAGPVGKFRGGMRISQLREDGPAAKAGLRVGDILVGLDKWETKSLKGRLFRPPQGRQDARHACLISARWRDIFDEADAAGVRCR